MNDRVATIKTQVILTWGAIRTIKGFAGVKDMISAVVAGVEAVTWNMSQMTGAEKRQAVVDLICDAIKLPAFLFFLNPFKALIVGWMVDVAIAQSNALLGHKKWMNQYATESPAFAKAAIASGIGINGHDVVRP